MIAMDSVFALELRRSAVSTPPEGVVGNAVAALRRAQKKVEHAKCMA